MVDNSTQIFTANVGEDSFPVIITCEGLQALYAYLKAYSKESVLIVADAVFSDSVMHPDKVITDIISDYPCFF